jgi:hypothetical protein
MVSGFDASQFLSAARAARVITVARRAASGESATPRS